MSRPFAGLTAQLERVTGPAVFYRRNRRGVAWRKQDGDRGGVNATRLSQ